MKIAPNLARPKEPTIALINVVFLMLVFFMIAGTLAPPLDPDLSLIKAQDLDGRAPPDTLVIHEDGKLWLRGVELTSASAFMERLPDDDRSVVRIVPDRDLPAKDLIAISDELRSHGAERILLVSERGLQ
ncbi:ExbD/TolR family protein [Marinibacterium profundimaris]|uniref:Biopolymer transporter ExbD n=1 Tax=Marinibacterium profundimaris TaxID=1679460 RepID=A0A225NGH3_9RHOB|nr:biopolymer transporter ExbD [Marinibacterium profundimaris]OWU72443.1 biopolymer transporter ExbD [Marinibacterium profundimaris]